MQKTASKHSNTIQARASAMIITELFGHVTFGNTFPGVQTPRGRGSAYFSWDYSRRKRNWKQCLCKILGGVLPIHLSCLSLGLFLGCIANNGYAKFWYEIVSQEFLALKKLKCMHCRCGYLCIKKKTTLLTNDWGNWQLVICYFLLKGAILSEGLFYLFSTHSPNKTRKYLIKVLETFVKQLLLLASHKDVLYRDPLGRSVWRAKRMFAWEATFTSCLAKVSSCSREQGREGRKVR